MRSEVSEPLLSVVVTTRNDNHGGDLNHRTQLFIDGLAAQAERHRIDVELILVEWNPPHDRPPVAAALRWPEETRYFEARIVVVPSSLHRRFEHSDRLPLFQMIAKNVGIRRARGRFVLATNIDVLFSHELIDHIARHNLSHRNLYRVDRYDVESAVPKDAPLDERLAWCDRHLVRICRREGTLDLRDDHLYRIYESMRVPLWFAGYVRVERYVWRFGVYVTRRARHASILAARATWAWMRKTAFSATARVLEVPRRLARLTQRALGVVPRRAPTSARLARRLEWWTSRVAARLRAKAAAEDVALKRARTRLTRPRLRRPQPLQAFHRVTSNVSAEWALLRTVVVGERARLRLHTNACGDFTLMSREAWAKVGGYPELELFSMHIDSLLLYQAHYSGIREVFIPHRLYHVEHAEGFKPDPEGLSELNTRLAENAIAQISDAQFLGDVIEMYKTKQPKFRNPETWGFSNDILGEHWVVQRAVRDEAADVPAAKVHA